MRNNKLPSNKNFDNATIFVIAIRSRLVPEGSYRRCFCLKIIKFSSVNGEMIFNLMYVCRYTIIKQKLYSTILLFTM